MSSVGTTQTKMTPTRGRGKSCYQCNKAPIEINCDFCDNGGNCGPCSELSATEISNMKRTKRKLKYECKHCETRPKNKDSNMSSSSGTNESQLIQIINALKDQIQRLEDKINSDNTKSASVDVDAVINEIEERKFRAKNIIIFEINESNEENAVDRINHDKQKVADIIPDINKDNIKVTRLGKFVINKKRPVRVMFQNEHQAKEILRKKKGDKRVKNDLTPVQRSKLTDLQNKLKEKIDKGDQGWTIKYISGQPTLMKLTIPSTPKNV